MKYLINVERKNNAENGLMDYDINSMVVNLEKVNGWEFEVKLLDTQSFSPSHDSVEQFFACLKQTIDDICSRRRGIALDPITLNITFNSGFNFTRHNINPRDYLSFSDKPNLTVNIKEYQGRTPPATYQLGLFPTPPIPAGFASESASAEFPISTMTQDQFLAFNAVMEPMGSVATSQTATPTLPSIEDRLNPEQLALYCDVLRVLDPTIPALNQDQREAFASVMALFEAVRSGQTLTTPPTPEQSAIIDSIKEILAATAPASHQGPGNTK